MMWYFNVTYTLLGDTPVDDYDVVFQCDIHIVM